MEKFQYGKQVTFQVEKVLEDFKTHRSHVKYVRTNYHGDILFMDGEVQFSTLDEHLYHKTLVRQDGRIGKNVLILGGGDGLALRDVYNLKKDVQRAVVVDWDEEFVKRFAMNYPQNNRSLQDKRTVLVHMDAYDFLNNCLEKFDNVIVDLPDPDGPEMEELYFKIIGSLGKVLTPNAVVSTHVGPVCSLSNEHPCWKFIEKLSLMIEDLFVNAKCTLQTIYVPSFSNEWGILHCPSQNLSSAPR